MPFTMANLTSRFLIFLLFNIIVAILSTVAGASRILAVFPHPAHSHQMVMRSLTIELARRGHELTVFTPEPSNDTNLPPHYTEVNLPYFYDFTASMDYYVYAKLGIWSLMHKWYKRTWNITDKVLSHSVMQRLISPSSTAKFDLIIVQVFFYDALNALSIRFNAPLVIISTLPLLAPYNYALGNVIFSSTTPDLLASYGDNMNLWQRFVNVYYQLRQIYEYNYKVLPKQDKICRKHFGDTVPHTHQLLSRVSLILVNAHPFFVHPRPTIPAVVYIGGFHLKRQQQKLPQDLEQILNDAKEGFIYFSLGTNIKSNNLPIDRRNMFLNTFATLPYKVVWKFESDYLANKHDNVVIRKWLPQQEVLAHPNIRLFITQGGIHSIDEAIENAVPMIGLPATFDQISNVNRLQNLGVGTVLSITDVNKEKFREVILEMVTNSSYKENMVKLRNLFRDLPHKPMDNAIWWIEHVIRHKGAQHLRNKSRDIPWYQDQMLDLMAIALGTTTLVIYIIVSIVRCIFNTQLSMQTKKKYYAKKQK